MSGIFSKLTDPQNVKAFFHHRLLRYLQKVFFYNRPISCLFVFLTTIVLLINYITKNDAPHLTSCFPAYNLSKKSIYNAAVSSKLEDIPPNTEINLPFPIRIAQKADKVGRYTTFFIIRHAPTKNNHIVHGLKFDSDILLTPGKELDCFLKLKKHIKFNKLYASNSLRASGTIGLLSKSNECIKSWLFDEQKLGHLEGMKKKDALKDSDFEIMSETADYRIPAGETGEAGETGNEVIKRMLFGIYKVAKENGEKTVGICTSQCTMNWIYKFLSNDFKTFIKIKNYEIIMFRYYNSNNTVELLTDNGSVSSDEAIRIYQSSSRQQKNQS